MIKLALVREGARHFGLKNTHKFQIGCWQDKAVYLTGDCFIQDIHNSTVNYPEMKEVRGTYSRRFKFEEMKENILI